MFLIGVLSSYNNALKEDKEENFKLVHIKFRFLKITNNYMVPKNREANQIVCYIV